MADTVSASIAKSFIAIWTIEGVKYPYLEPFNKKYPRQNHFCQKFRIKKAAMPNTKDKTHNGIEFVMSDIITECVL